MRPEDDKTILQEALLMPSNLETVDGAILDYVKEDLDLFCTTNKGWKRAPMVWVSAERGYQIKNNKDLLDSSGALILPIITIERASVVKDPTKKGTAWANIHPKDSVKGGSVIIARRIKQDKTRNFAVADAYRKRNQLNFPRKNDKVVYETISVPMPTYVEITYNITLRTEYQQQMNQLVQPFMTRTGGINYFIVRRDGHRYESFIDNDFAQENNVADMGEDSRNYQTTVSVRVLGYLLGDGDNQERPKIVVRESVAEVKVQRERVVLGDELDHLTRDRRDPGILTHPLPMGENFPDVPVSSKK